jgi:hypothetical protein
MTLAEFEKSLDASRFISGRLSAGNPIDIDDA